MAHWRFDLRFLENRIVQARSELEPANFFRLQPANFFANFAHSIPLNFSLLAPARCIGQVGTAESSVQPKDRRAAPPEEPDF